MFTMFNMDVFKEEHQTTTMATHERDQDPNRELMSMAMLPGLTFAVREALEQLNAARTSIGLPGYELTELAVVRRGRPPLPPLLEEAPPKEPTPIDDRPKGEYGHRIGPLPPEVHKQKYTKQARSTIGESVRARWELIKSAGISTAGMRGSPSLALMERARKVLTRRGEAIPEGLKFGGSKKAQTKAAKVGKNGRTYGPLAPSVKESIAEAARERRRLCAEAGVDTLGRNPSKAMVARARKILADRASRAAKRQSKSTPVPKPVVNRANAERAKRGRPPLANAVQAARSAGAANRWDLIKRAGMSMDFKGAPTKAMMEEARRILLGRVNDRATKKREETETKMRAREERENQATHEQETYQQAEGVTDEILNSPAEAEETPEPQQQYHENEQ